MNLCTSLPVGSPRAFRKWVYIFPNPQASKQEGQKESERLPLATYLLSYPVEPMTKPFMIENDIRTAAALSHLQH